MSKKHTISAAILLLISFWFSDLLAAQYFPDDLNMPAREKRAFVSGYPKVFKSMKETPLWLLAKDRKKISYRLIQSQRNKEHWSRQWVILRLDRSAKMSWVLTIKQTKRSRSDQNSKVNRKRRLSKEEVKEFQELFAQLQFWELPSVGALEHEEGWLDFPSIWILEAVENGRYHLVQRIVPTSTHWVPDRQYQRMKEEEGYPDIDRATSEEVNRRLVAVGEFLVNLSGLELELH
jgi:hypothetical protein